MEQLSKEHLLQFRFKVIADYPGNRVFEVGEIIEGRNELIYCDADGPKYSDYPHLFERLGWWEHRKETDLPLYVRRKDSIGSYSVINGSKEPECHIVKQHFSSGMLRNRNYFVSEWQSQSYHYGSFNPITAEDYNTYLNTKEEGEQK